VKLVVVSAPSGAGKTTLCQRLLNEFSQLRLSISTTTRAPRGQELNGREYFFVSKEEFEKQISQNEFAEWAKVHDFYYGTSEITLQNAFSAGKSVLLDIDVQGAKSIRSKYDRQALLVFVSPPSLEVLEQRLRARGTDSEETIQKRMKNSSWEMSQQSEFDQIIINDDLERAYHELRLKVLHFLGNPA